MLQAEAKPSRFNLFSAITFSYLNQIIKKLSAPASDVTSEDLALTAADNIEPDVAFGLFSVKWADELKREKPSLLRALRRTFLNELLFAAALKLVWGTLIVLCASFFIREVGFTQNMCISDWLSARLLVFVTASRLADRQEQES